MGERLTLDVVEPEVREAAVMFAILRRLGLPADRILIVLNTATPGSPRGGVVVWASRDKPSEELRETLTTLIARTEHESRALASRRHGVLGFAIGGDLGHREELVSNELAALPAILAETGNDEMEAHVQRSRVRSQAVTVVASLMRAGFPKTW